MLAVRSATLWHAKPALPPRADSRRAHAQKLRKEANALVRRNFDPDWNAIQAALVDGNADFPADCKEDAWRLARPKISGFVPPPPGFAMLCARSQWLPHSCFTLLWLRALCTVRSMVRTARSELVKAIKRQVCVFPSLRALHADYIAAQKKTDEQAAALSKLQAAGRRLQLRTPSADEACWAALRTLVFSVFQLQHGDKPSSTQAGACVVVLETFFSGHGACMSLLVHARRCSS